MDETNKIYEVYYMTEESEDWEVAYFNSKEAVHEFLDPMETTGLMVMEYIENENITEEF